MECAGWLDLYTALGDTTLLEVHWQVDDDFATCSADIMRDTWIKLLYIYRQAAKNQIMPMFAERERESERRH